MKISGLNTNINKISKDILDRMVSDNLITVNIHPELNLRILNYSPKAQYQDIWDEYILACRGLVIDEDGDIIARPFPKFFNYEQLEISDIPFGLEFDVFEKMDGSLGILFHYRGEWILVTRGSFISEQAIEGRKILSEISNNNLSFLNEEYTYLFEIIYPDNRIVVDYGNKRDLVLLSAVETKTGIELLHEDLLQYRKYFTIVKKYKGVDDINKLRELEEDNKEGFVVRFLNGFRLKVKFEEYVRLHRILTNVSNIVIWEHLKNNYNFDELLDKVPDEFYNWVKKTKKELLENYKEIEYNATKEFIRIYYYEDSTDRKKFALKAVETDYSSILFAIYTKKNYDQIIWKMIRPEYSKPFKDGYDSVELITNN